MGGYARCGVGSQGKPEGLVPAAMLLPIADDPSYAADLIAAHSLSCRTVPFSELSEVQEPRLVHQRLKEGGLELSVPRVG